MATTIDMGRVTPIYQGTYDAETAYELNDLVVYNANVYWHVGTAETTGTAPGDESVWALVFTAEIAQEMVDACAKSQTAAEDSAAAAADSTAAAAESAAAAADSAAAAKESESNASGSATAAANAAAEAESLALLGLVVVDGVLCAEVEE